MPLVSDSSWPRTDIDHFILARLEAEGLRPVDRAAPLDLLRRMHYDLTGLPPTPARIRAFLTASEHDAEAAVLVEIDRLLASPRFGERWGRHWLDLARYAESNGGIRNELMPLAPRYREYVISAFNRDKPYDRFVREQLAGDLLPAGNDAQRNEQLIATGFLALGPKDLVERNTHRLRMSIVAEQIDVLGRAFLAQTLACAECHDHKFDPFPTRDYYALAGILYSSQPLVGVRNKNTSYVGKLAPLAGSDVVFTDADHKTLRKADKAAKQAYRDLRDEKHRLLLEAGLADASESEQKAFLDQKPHVRKLAADLERKRADYAKIETRFQESLTQSAIAMRDVEPEDLAIHIRGEDSSLGEIVPRGFPQVLTNHATPEIDRSRSGRLELADWIVSPENPLTARVMVNRIWLHLFGEGLVASPDNFGTTGQAPSHPELLDHLARRFVSHDWSMKWLIREIMRSRVYQLSAGHQERASRVDPANRLHWRMNRRRLDSDALLDSLRFASGDLELGAPPQRFAIVDGDQRTKSFDRAGWREPVLHRRTIYQPHFRDYVPEAWSVFDFPDPELLEGNRDATTVPTQALYFLNSPHVVDQSRHLARRLRSHPEHDRPEAWIRNAYLHVLGREPGGEELAEARRFLETFPRTEKHSDPEQALAGFCQALFASAEFRFLH